MDPLEEATLAALGMPLPRRLGVAVSGGSDSLALLHILKALSRTADIEVFAVTVDHGLRPEAAQEASDVAAQCAALGIAHQTLRWQGWDGAGNLQDAARQARYGLMGDWAKALRLDAVAVGHTAQDQAETVLMRLARRAGVDGLAAMSVKSLRHGVVWLRPLLSQRRAALQTYLAARGVKWVSDASNADLRFDRIKARAALESLEDLGIGVEELAAVARNMAVARTALRAATRDALGNCARPTHGAVAIDPKALADLPEEIRRRIWIHALSWVNQRPYPPRSAALEGFMKSVEAGERAVLGGCAVVLRRGKIWLFREFKPVSGMVCARNGLWDGRWRVVETPSGMSHGTHEIRALGAKGLEQCDNWRGLGLPRGALLSHPALWHGDTVVTSPAAKPRENWRWTLDRCEKAFFDTPL